MSDTLWRAALVEARSLRIWFFKSDGSVTSESSPVESLHDLPGPIIAAGLDAAMRAVPAKPLGPPAHAAGLPQVAAIPMLGQHSPAALSRGSETAIAGYLHSDPTFDGVLLVVGEETCWAHISAEEVVSFRTFLTSTIADALGATTPETNDAYETALSETLSRPDRLAQHLSSAKAGDTGQIWTHLIGAEIASAKPYWLGQRVVVLADGQAGAPYAKALELQGAMIEHAPLEPAYLKGFQLAWDLVTDQSSS